MCGFYVGFFFWTKHYVWMQDLSHAIQTLGP